MDHQSLKLDAQYNGMYSVQNAVLNYVCTSCSVQIFSLSMRKDLHKVNKFLTQTPQLIQSKTKCVKATVKTQQQCINITSVLLWQHFSVLLDHLQASIQRYEYNQCISCTVGSNITGCT